MPALRTIVFGIDDVIGCLHTHESSAREFPDQPYNPVRHVKATPRPHVQRLISELQRAGHPVVLLGDSTTEYAKHAVSLLMPEFPLNHVAGIKDVRSGVVSGADRNMAMEAISCAARISPDDRQHHGPILVDAKPRPSGATNAPCSNALAEKLAALKIGLDAFVSIPGFVASGPIPREPKLNALLSPLTAMLQPVSPSPGSVAPIEPEQVGMR